VSESKPNLVFLCQTLPFPPDSGVALRTLNVLRLLSRHFDITAFCFYRRASHPTNERVNAGIAGLSAYAKVTAFEIPQEHSLARLLADHARSIVWARPYTFFAHQSSSFERELKKAVETSDFAVAHLDSLDLSAHIDGLRGLPTICVHHNVESQLLRSRAATFSEPMASYVRLQALLTEKEEARFCHSFAANVVVSGEDKRLLLDVAPDAIIDVVPNGVDTKWFHPTQTLEKAGIVFVGGYNWHPNRDGMSYFCSSILPLLRSAGVKAPITWVGSAPNKVKKEMLDRFGLILTGYVDDIRPIVDRSACFIVPLRAGGGTRLKILDAWAMGKAVVSTRVGAEGLQAHDGQNILLRDSPEAFAHAVKTVLEDDALRLQLEAAGRATAESTYDWDVLEGRLIPTYTEAIARHRA
jgi:polysaccharide biosynthesis protein PslH